MFDQNKKSQQPEFVSNLRNHESNKIQDVQPNEKQIHPYMLSKTYQVMSLNN